MTFQGFPARMSFTPVPNLFLNSIMPKITDVNELKATLFVFAEVYKKKGYPKYVTHAELASGSLLQDLKTEDKIFSALEKASERGTIIRVDMKKGVSNATVYLLNDEQGRRAHGRITNGELELAGMKTVNIKQVKAEAPPDIFTLYEQNIGMLTPMIADELLDAEKAYPAEWLREAIKEAVKQNKRKWSYVTAILKHWTEEGKGDGTYQRHTETDPDKYVKGRYGRMVQR